MFIDAFKKSGRQKVSMRDFLSNHTRSLRFLWLIPGQTAFPLSIVRSACPERLERQLRFSKPHFSAGQGSIRKRGQVRWGRVIISPDNSPAIELGGG
jgi:hypothetical protein